MPKTSISPGLKRLVKKNPMLAVAILLVMLAVNWLKPAADEQTLPTDSDCRVNSVYDGDTMRLTCGGEKVKVRLYCIDTPEMQQKPWGIESRDALRAITPDEIELIAHDKDRYGRLVAEVMANGVRLNLKMVELGMAAVYPRYCKAEEYFAAQQKAQDAALGIWSKSGLHQSPWEWRKQKRQ